MAVFLTAETVQCKAEAKINKPYRKEIPFIVKQLYDSCLATEGFQHVGPEPVPCREGVFEIIQRACRLLFPGYFTRRFVDQVNVEYYLGQEAVSLFDLLSQQITLSFRHECLRRGLPCSRCQQRGNQEAIRFLRRLDGLRSILATDVRAAYDGDPAAKSHDEIIYCYPGLFAVLVFRVAHQIYRQQVPLLPRIMTEYAHSLTGIDIHPVRRSARVSSSTTAPG